MDKEKIDRFRTSVVKSRALLVLLISDQKIPVEKWIRKVSYFFLLTSNFPCAQIDSVFASSRQKMSPCLLSLPAAVGENFGV